MVFEQINDKVAYEGMCQGRQKEFSLKPDKDDELNCNCIFLSASEEDFQL